MSKENYKRRTDQVTAKEFIKELTEVIFKYEDDYGATTCDTADVWQFIRDAKKRCLQKKFK